MTGSPSSHPSNPYRLGRDILPSRYTLALEPDLAAARFTGHVVIDAKVVAASPSIVLNAIDLDIHTVTVDGDDASFSLDEVTQRLTIDHPVQPGEISIAISFTGVLNDRLRGFYRSTFRSADGTEHVIGTTQMQATDCRRAFPCFDEPDFKAVFDITLIVEPGLLAVSNGPEVERTHEAGKDVVRFAPTMVMSTYLVAFVVGPLEATEPVEVPRAGGGTIPLRVIHVPGKGHLTGFALDAGAFALGWYQDYYGIPYPTDKCDMLALPDFAAGAMENLGCITYRESLLLADTSSATQFELQNLADVITHELAHMWFGDLVTMRWWNGIWLNEAFATFMEVACCDAYRPDWKRWTSFSLERSAAFEVDSLAATRSVEYPVEAPADCDGMFDVLTYQKGGSLLRMLEQYLGAAQFRAGVSHYLRAHEYGNTETGDLWDALEAVNPGQPVRRMMDSWIWQPGYPLVSAHLDRGGADGAALVLRQSRFAFGDTEDPTLWVVPVHLDIDGVSHKVLLDGPELRVALPSPDVRVVVNAGGHGVYRVAYDAELRARVLGPELATLTTIDRYNLVDDAWNEAVAGRMHAADFVTVAEGFADEHDTAVWQAIAIGLRGVWRLTDAHTEPVLAARIRALLGHPLAWLGTEPAEGEDDLRAKLRGLVVTLLGTIGHDDATVQRCRELLAADAAGTPVDPELLAAATSVVAANGTDADYERFLRGFRTASTPQAQLRWLYALAEFPSPALMDRTLALAMSGEVKSQNAPFVINRALDNRDRAAQAWEFTRRNWAQIAEHFPQNLVVRTVQTAKWITDPVVVADVQSFFAEHPIPQAAKTLDQLLERQRVNAALAARERDALAGGLGA